MVDDFILLHMQHFGDKMLKLVDCGLTWPPPERIYFEGEGFREAKDGDAAEHVFKLISRSQLTDEQAEKTTHVMRGAEYRYERTI